jgi:hypothetical protein
VAIRAVFVCDGGDLSVYRTIEVAAAHVEVYDLDVLSFFADDGTVLQGTSDEQRVRLTLTSERRPDELRERLQAFLPAVGLDRGLADDPVSAAQALFELEWQARAFQWFPWLDRRLHGQAPAALRREADT